MVVPFWYSGWYGLYSAPYYDFYGDRYGSSLPFYSRSVTLYTAPETYVEAAETIAAGAPAEDDGNSAGSEYSAKARSAFEQGDYRNALRLANHAAIELPEDAAVHELMSLSLFALQDYRGAAIEAHAAVGLGRLSEWATIFAYYGNAEAYTKQFRELEKYVRENPKSPEARFLLGYHDLLTGNKAAAKAHLQEAVALTPQDKLAKKLLDQL